MQNIKSFQFHFYLATTLHVRTSLLHSIEDFIRLFIVSLFNRNFYLCFQPWKILPLLLPSSFSLFLYSYTFIYLFILNRGSWLISLDIFLCFLIYICSIERWNISPSVRSRPVVPYICYLDFILLSNLTRINL